MLRSFLQAQAYLMVSQSLLTRAVTWLLEHQGPRGEFCEVGRVIHTEMQAGLDDAPAALTAFVLIALLEDESYAVGPDCGRVHADAAKIQHTKKNSEFLFYLLCV